VLVEGEKGKPLKASSTSIAINLREKKEKKDPRV
jgi:hypothetical protein